MTAPSLLHFGETETLVVCRSALAIPRPPSAAITADIRSAFAAWASRAVAPSVWTPNENEATSGTAEAVPVPVTVITRPVGELEPCAVAGRSTTSTATTAVSMTSAANGANLIAYLLGCVPEVRRRRAPTSRHAVAVEALPKPFRYGCQPFGIRGVARWMKSTGAGGRGFTRGVIETSSGRRFPLRMLHGAHEVTTFSQMDSPPRLRGTTWSSVSLPPLVPQYMQRQPSRAKSARREILRCSVRGTRTYWTSRMTFGRGKATVADLRGSSSSSITSAFPLNTSTCARRTVVTFKGS